MRTFVKLAISTLAIATPAILLAAEVEDGCAEVLKYSARDYSVEKSEIGVAVKVYDQYCENDSVKSGTNFNAGLETVIKAVPVKFSLGSGSAEERTKYFCKTFDSDYKRNEQSYKSISQVVASTTTAWLGCKSLASKGIVFRPQVAKTQLLIEILRTSPDAVTVEGITYNSKYASCSVPNSNDSKSVTIANQKTTKDLSPSSWTITCSRTPENTSKETIYPAFDISVATTKGPFLMPVAADAKFPYQWSSELQQQLTQVTNQTKSNSEGLQRIGVQSGTFVITANGTRPLHDTSRCDTSDPVRGEKFGFVPFSPQFETTPTVTLALSHIDIGDPSIRLTAQVIDVDKTGFHYRFYTWCNTNVSGASASWIAVAK